MTAVDGDRRASHETGRIRREQQEWAVQVVEPTQPSLRNSPDQSFSGLA
jgi:hypothetical protein